jgi:hypothetical protein
LRARLVRELAGLLGIDPASVAAAADPDRTHLGYHAHRLTVTEPDPTLGGDDNAAGGGSFRFIPIIGHETMFALLGRCPDCVAADVPVAAITQLADLGYYLATGQSPDNGLREALGWGPHLPPPLSLGRPLSPPARPHPGALQPDDGLAGDTGHPLPPPAPVGSGRPDAAGDAHHRRDRNGTGGGSFRFIPIIGRETMFALLGRCPDCVAADVPVAAITQLADLGYYLAAGQSPDNGLREALGWDPNHRPHCPWAAH